MDKSIQKSSLKEQEDRKNHRANASEICSRFIMPYKEVFTNKYAKVIVKDTMAVR